MNIVKEFSKVDKMIRDRYTPKPHMFLLYIKSHCEAPDFEQEYLADTKGEAVDDAWIEHNEHLDLQTIQNNMEEI